MRSSQQLSSCGAGAVGETGDQWEVVWHMCLLYCPKVVVSILVVSEHMDTDEAEVAENV